MERGYEAGGKWSQIAAYFAAERSVRVRNRLICNKSRPSLQLLWQLGRFFFNNRKNWNENRGAMESDYIRIMIESLEKKRDLLKQITELNQQQRILLQDPNLSPDEFEQNMKYKSDLVDQLGFLDDGFEKLFDRVRDTLNADKAAYASEIQKMQSLIKEITAQTNMVQTQEARNREQVMRKFSDVREQVKGVRNSQKVVKQYYQNMMKSGNAAPQFIDNKK